MAEKNQKHNDILTSARVLFAENGFHNTRMEDIAINAGVGKGTLYEYFKNKQEIFDETCIQFVEAIHEQIEEISNMDISFKDKILCLFQKRKNSTSEFLDKNPIDYIMSYKNIVSEKVLKSIFDHIGDMHKIVVKMIDQGKDEGVVKKEIASELIACSIVGTMGEFFNLKMHKKRYDYNEEEIIISLLFNGFSSN